MTLEKPGLVHANTYQTKYKNRPLALVTESKKMPL